MTERTTLRIAFGAVDFSVCEIVDDGPDSILACTRGILTQKAVFATQQFWGGRCVGDAPLYEGISHRPIASFREPPFGCGLLAAVHRGQMKAVDCAKKVLR